MSISLTLGPVADTGALGVGTGAPIPQSPVGVDHICCSGRPAYDRGLVLC